MTYNNSIKRNTSVVYFIVKRHKITIGENLLLKTKSVGDTLSSSVKNLKNITQTLLTYVLSLIN